MFGEVRKIDRSIEQRRGRAVFGLSGFDAQRERRQRPPKWWQSRVGPVQQRHRNIVPAEVRPRARSWIRERRGRRSGRPWPTVARWLAARSQLSNHSGTGTDSTISRRTESVVSDFFCSEAWRELATTR